MFRSFFIGIAALTIGSLAVPAIRAEDEKDIVETAVSAGQFKTLAKALGEADLIETLKGKGPFTVFAPTDAAFAKVPKEALAALLKDKDKLKAVLTYHVVAGKVMAADVVKLDSAKTVQGSKVKIKVVDEKVKINDATVIKADIVTTNGVIHVIDAVLLPPVKVEGSGAMLNKEHNTVADSSCLSARKSSSRMRIARR
jgi:uncharacterized surface protein with fasciclin (FAS1) repeats